VRAQEGRQSVSLPAGGPTESVNVQSVFGIGNVLNTIAWDIGALLDGDETVLLHCALLYVGRLEVWHFSDTATDQMNKTPNCSTSTLIGTLLDRDETVLLRALLYVLSRQASTMALVRYCDE
jgi:hypothetical protein